MNLVALLGWVTLLAALAVPRLRVAMFPAIGLGLPCLLAAIYLAVLATAASAPYRRSVPFPPAISA